MILGAYTEELNLFQICEMLVPEYSSMYARCRCMADSLFAFNITFIFVQNSGLSQPS